MAISVAIVATWRSYTWQGKGDHGRLHVRSTNIPNRRTGLKPPDPAHASLANHTQARMLGTGLPLADVHPPTSRPACISRG